MFLLHFFCCIVFSNLLEGVQMKKYFIILISFFLYINCFAQHSDPSLLKFGYLNGNEIETTIHNDGAFAGISSLDVRGVWKNNEYINNSTLVLGLELPLKDYNGDGIVDTIHSVIISRGPRNHQSEERSPIDNHFWGFNPLPGYANQNNENFAISTDPINLANFVGRSSRMGL